MDKPAYLDGIDGKQIQTKRLEMHVLSATQEGDPVIFLHGNFSAALLWEETMLALPDGFRGIAPDLRGLRLEQRINPSMQPAGTLIGAKISLRSWTRLGLIPPTSSPGRLAPV